IRNEIRALKAYSVPDSTGMIKLDAMENPYHLPAELTQAIAARVAGAALNRYPDADSRALKAQLRTLMKVPADMQIVLGNGSDELIHLLAVAVARPGSVMFSVDPTFVMFRLLATVAGMRYESVALTRDFQIDEQATLAAIAQLQPALIFIAYPNNPTGNLFDAGVIARIIEAAPGIVVVDEAYHAFAGATFMPQLADFPNLVVMRTLSKLGLAGLRLGLVAGRGAWLNHLDKVRLPYNVNVLSQVVAGEVLQHADVLDAQAAEIRAERTRLAAELRRIPGIAAYASEANFILFRTAHANAVFSGLKERGVLIKNLNGTHPLLRDCLRVTVGAPAENTQFLAALNALKT
ncbi:MAG: histidinol-phosphate transaminase, partial [Burkholderiales bacterium]